MKIVSIILFIALFFFSCKNNQQKTNLGDSSAAKSIYTEVSESRFEILSKNPENGFVYRTVESNFKPVFIQFEKFDTQSYFANITTTTEKWLSAEGQERNIKVKIKAFDNPSKTIVEINRKCDDIDLQTKLYKTVNYGCCGSVDHYKIFNYENKQIIEGDDAILAGSFSDSDLEIYVGFTQQTNDSTVLGTLYYTTYSPKKVLDRFEIKIKLKSSSINTSEIMCAPKISLQTNKSIDKFDAKENEYILWALGKDANETAINNLTIKFHIDCTHEHKFKNLYIPIIKGKPFGKENKTHEMVLD